MDLTRATALVATAVDVAGTRRRWAPVRRHAGGVANVCTPPRFLACCVVSALALIFFLAGTFPARGAADAGGEGLAVEDFEGELHGWTPGIKRVQQPVKEGQAAGLWDLTATTSLKYFGAYRDWSGYDRLDFWCYSKEATGARFLLILFSENPRTEGQDYFWTVLTVDWREWKQFHIPYRAFRVSRQPLGWDRVDSVALYSAGYRDCFPVEGTQLVFDDMRLSQAGPDQAGVLADFEFDTPAWGGMIRDPEVKHGGEASGRWENFQDVKLIRCTSIPHDWSGWDNLEMWVHSGKANGQTVKVFLYSDDPGTELTDCFYATLTIDWEGWKHLKLSRHRDFQAAHQPKGWAQIDQIVLGGSGWGIEPKADTVLRFDEIRLTKDAWTPSLVISDMEEGDWPWTGLVRDTAHVKSGKASGKWADTKKSPYIRITRIPHDWTGLDALSFWCYSEVANNAAIKILLYSDNPATEKMDCYSAAFKVDWQGWKFLTFPKKLFHANYQVAGWQKIDCLTIAAGGWGLIPREDTTLWLDDVSVARATTAVSRK